jgi:hypothetical protein
MRFKVFALIGVVGAMSGLCLAQTNTQQSSSQAPKDAERAATPVDYTLPGNRLIYLQQYQSEIPPGDGTWVIQVETTGGYVPIQRTITLTSKGRVTIDDSSGACSFYVEGGFPEIDRLIGAANEAGWGERIFRPEPTLEAEPTSACNDCRLNRLRLNGRGADGTAYGHAVYWNEFTFAKLKKEVAAISSAVEKIKRECPHER